MTRKRLLMFFFHVIIIFIVNLISCDEITIANYGMIFLLYSSFSFLCLVSIQKKIVSPINILYGTFVLFQAGVPIAFFIKENYSNYYITLFSAEMVLAAAKYTLWSIEAFSLTLLLFLDPRSKKKKRIFFSRNAAVNNDTHVFFIARIFFIITAAVILPLYAYVAFLSIRLGFSQEIRSLVATNSFFNLIRAFFFPSFFLLVCYGKEKSFTRVAKYIYVIVCIFALLSGNRADGILWLITYFYYNRLSEKNTVFNKILIILGVGLIVFVAAYIGQTRLGSSSSDMSSVLINLIGEMGFNFFSICFVMLYVPSARGFLFGLSYIESIICMLPKSLDVLHLFDSMRNSLPAQWLYNINHERFGTLLDFGTGFSMIGESYMNFSWAGFLISALYGFILCKVFNGQWNNDNKWEKYIQMTVFLGLLTFPRRGFIEFLNVISYSIFFLALMLIITYRKKKS